MIIWIASYPKSGNTLIRSLIYSLIASPNGELDLSKLSFIPNYNQFRFFEKLINEEERFDVKKISDMWRKSQENIITKGKIKFLKTHNANCIINQNHFTSKNTTAGVIYIVRDPRDVLLSASRHFSVDHNWMKKFMFDKNAKLMPRPNLKHEVITILGSWSDNYKSWLNSKNCLLIKYEDILNDKKKVVSDLIKYINNFLKIEISQNKIDKAIETTSFENMKKQEERGLFKENVFNKKKKINFFNKGLSKSWVENLNKNIQIEIEKEFQEEMKHLGYL